MTNRHKRPLRGQPDEPTALTPANTIYFVVESNSHGAGKWKQLPHTITANVAHALNRADWFRDKFNCPSGYRIAMVPRAEARVEDLDL